MKILNSKIKILLGVFILGIVVLFVLRNSPEDSDFIDLQNSVVTENEGSVATVNIANKEMVQIRFSYEVNGISYSDAINVPKDQYESMSQEDIENIKTERFKNWVANVNAQSKQEAEAEIKTNE